MASPGSWGSLGDPGVSHSAFSQLLFVAAEVQNGGDVHPTPSRVSLAPSPESSVPWGLRPSLQTGWSGFTRHQEP